MTSKIGPIHCGLLIFFAAVLSWWGGLPPVGLDENAPLNKFSAGRALQNIRMLTPDNKPHPMGSEENDRVRERLLAAFASLGISARTERELTCNSSERFAALNGCAEVVNVIAPITEGTDPTAKPVILMSHYDSVGVAAGAGDAVHGVATILEVARIIRSEGQFRNPIMALITDGEEYGLFGANSYFADAEKAANAGIIINLEARGSSGSSALFETSDDAAWLIDLFAEHADNPLTNSLTLAIYKTLPNDTDMSESLRAGVPGVNFAFADKVAHYHTPLDNIDIINPSSVQHQGDNMLAMTRALGNADLVNPPQGDAIYVSLFSTVVVRMPESFALPLTILALAMMSFAAVRMPASEKTGAWRIVGAIFFTPLMLIIAAGAGVAVQFLLGLSPAPAPGFAYPLPLRFAYYLVTFGSMMALAVSFGRWLGVKYTFVSVWFGVGIVALTLTFVLPGGSILFLLPAIVAAIVMVGSVLRTDDNNVPVAAQYGAAAFLVLFAWPFVDMFELLVGFLFPPAITVVVGLAVLGLAPIMVAWSERAMPKNAKPWFVRWYITLGLIGAGVVAAVVTVVLPSYSAFMPMRMNILHFTDTRAQPIVSAPVWRAANDYLPESMRKAADFSEGLEGGVLRLLQPDYIAPAPADSRPKTQVTVIRDEQINGKREVELAFDMAPHARSVRVIVPESEKLTAFQYADEEMAGTYDPASSFRGYHIFTCFVGACRNTVFTLEPTTDDVSKAPWLVYTVVSGLPEGGTVLQNARPDWVVASQNGDETVTIGEITFDQ